MMELKAFVTETIREILEGVIDAQRQLIPALDYNKDGYVQIGSNDPHMIEFDISVTSSETSTDEVKGGLTIKVVEFGGKRNSSNNNSATNKIKFSVPVAFPMKANKKF